MNRPQREQLLVLVSALTDVTNEEREDLMAVITSVSDDFSIVALDIKDEPLMFTYLAAATARPGTFELITVDHKLFSCLFSPLQHIAADALHVQLGDQLDSMYQLRELPPHSVLQLPTVTHDTDSKGESDE